MRATSMHAGPSPAVWQHRLGGYREYAPPPDLSTVAEGLWIHHLDEGARLGAGAAHRVLPDPAFSLAFTCTRDAMRRPRDPRLIAVGPVTASRPFSLRPGFEMAAIKLKLEWVEPLFDLVPRDHRDALDDLLPLLPAFAERLGERLLESRSPEEAASILAAAVRERISERGTTGTPGAHPVLDMVRRTGGRLPVARMGEHLARSARHLRRTVRDGAGVSLKAFARTVRFLRAVTAADRVREPAWARLAADTGFCDQSHLVREFHAFAGLSPARLFRERRAEAELSNTV